MLGLIGILFDLQTGFFVGAGFGIFILLIFFKFGDKLVLMFSSARYINDDEFLVERIKNFCTHVELEDVKVYWSNVFYNNIYYVNSYWGEPSIIIGREVYNNLLKNELNSLIYATLLRVKSNESKHRTIVNLIATLAFGWVFFIGSKIKNKSLRDSFIIFLCPAFYFKSLFYRKRDDTKYFDLEIFKMEKLKRDYVSALYKVNKLNICRPNSLGTFVLSGLSHTFNNTEDALTYLLIQNENHIENRIKTITENLK
jgi:hypothetical protein